MEPVSEVPGEVSDQVFVTYISQDPSTPTYDVRKSRTGVDKEVEDFGVSPLRGSPPGVPPEPCGGMGEVS